jgi:hypothetical protein
VRSTTLLYFIPERAAHSLTIRFQDRAGVPARSECSQLIDDRVSFGRRVMVDPPHTGAPVSLRGQNALAAPNLPLCLVLLGSYRPAGLPSAGRAKRGAARAIDGDDAISLGQPFEYPANLKVLHHGAVTVQQDEGRPLAPLEEMEADPFHIEGSGRGVGCSAPPDVRGERSPEPRFRGRLPQLEQPPRAASATIYRFF